MNVVISGTQDEINELRYKLNKGFKIGDEDFYCSVKIIHMADPEKELSTIEFDINPPKEESKLDVPDGIDTQQLFWDTSKDKTHIKLTVGDSWTVSDDSHLTVGGLEEECICPSAALIHGHVDGCDYAE